MQEAEIITIETIPKTPFVSFEEVGVEVFKEFPCSSRFVRYCTKIHSHWIVCVLYFLGPWEVVAIAAFAVDLVIDFFRYGLPWLISNCCELVKRLFNYVWGLIGESIKAYIIQFLQKLGKWSAILALAYLAYAFIKTGSYSKLLVPLCEWLGW